MTADHRAPVTEGGTDPVGYSVPIAGFTTYTTASGPGQLVFVSGLTARSADGTIQALGDVGGQARQILAALQGVLQEAGGTLTDVRQIRTYVLDIDCAWAAVEPVWREFWPDRLPASTMVQVSRLFDARQLIETDAIAFVSPILEYA